MINWKLHYPRIFFTIISVCTLTLTSIIILTESPASFFTSTNFKRYSSPKEEIKKILIITTVRSGSSFFGDLLQSHPSSYYFFEPLMRLTERGKNKSVAVDFLRDLLDCNFQKWKTNFEVLLNVTIQFQSSNNAYKSLARTLCDGDSVTGNKDCYDLNAASRICSRSTFRVLKSVRLSLESTAEILLKEIPELTVFYLIRDPRGTMRSRRHPKIWKWCGHDKTCNSPAELCQGLYRDITRFPDLRSTYGDRFTVVRFEELACQPFEISPRIFKLLGFQHLPEETISFLEKNTRNDYHRLKFKLTPKKKGYNYATSRESSTVAFAWQRVSNLTDIREVELNCQDVLESQDIYNYKFSLNKSTNCDCTGIMEKEPRCFPDSQTLRTIHLLNQTYLGSNIKAARVF